jgi:hypothetical protein
MRPLSRTPKKAEAEKAANAAEAKAGKSKSGAVEHPRSMVAMAKSAGPVATAISPQGALHRTAHTARHASKRAVCCFVCDTGRNLVQNTTPPAAHHRLSPSGSGGLLPAMAPLQPLTATAVQETRTPPRSAERLTALEALPAGPILPAPCSLRPTATPRPAASPAPRPISSPTSLPTAMLVQPVAANSPLPSPTTPPDRPKRTKEY